MIRIVSTLFIVAALLSAGCRRQTSATTVPSAVKTITTPTGIAMVVIPAGTFVMGSNAGDDDEKPAHSVAIASIYMDRYEVTQKAYEGLMGSNPSKFKDPMRPVERASWLSAIKYCNMRSMKEGLQPCYNVQSGECNFAASGYRLPTEAEWEYACRAGTTGAFSFGENAAELPGNAWLKSNSNQTTHPVGQKPANRWGLYDMYGNVAEWCNDRYGEKEYAASAAGKSAGNAIDNPHGPATGNERVLRGGSWRGGADRCRSSARASESPGLADVCFGYEAYGFRCVRAAR